MNTIAVSNFKGGVGKTTVCHNVAYELSRKGKSVLLIDFDPQGTLSYWLRDEEGVPIKQRAVAEGKSLANVLVPKAVGCEPAGLADVLYRTRWAGVDVVPATLALLKAKDSELCNPYALRFAIEALPAAGREYDYVLIDTRPDLDAKTTNAFCAASRVVLPVRCDGAMQEGLIESLQAIGEVGTLLTQFGLPELQTRVLLSAVKPNTLRDRTGAEMLEGSLPKDGIFETRIHDTVKLGEASMRGCALREYVDACGSRSGRRVADDFEALAGEIADWAA